MTVSLVIEESGISYERFRVASERRLWRWGEGGGGSQIILYYELQDL